jgi:LacI family transcriptional regulator/LacI family repressor for deo operon, udp, cdd, tsx, nupC, and nupG
MARRVSLRQVASVANVSPSTVSRYLRGELTLNSDTEGRIDSAIADLGYDRKAAHGTGDARSSLALVIPNFTNPFFTALAERFTSIAQAAGLQTLVIRGGAQHEEELTLARLLESNIDLSGLVYGGMSQRSEQLVRATKMGLPVVAIDKQLDDPSSLDTVTVDNYGGAFQATTYLLSLGHRRVAMLAGPREFSTTRARLQGYTDALAREGIEVDPALVRHGNHSERLGASVFPHLLGLVDPPSAIFATSDISAIGVLSAAEIHGLVIPDDLSVVGYDGIRMSEWLRPKLTTVEQPIDALAQAAIVSIMRQLKQEGNSRRASTEPQEVVLPMRLVIRGSTAAPARPGHGMAAPQ